MRLKLNLVALKIHIEILADAILLHTCAAFEVYIAKCHIAIAVSLKYQ